MQVTLVKQVEIELLELAAMTAAQRYPEEMARSCHHLVTNLHVCHPLSVNQKFTRSTPSRRSLLAHVSSFQSSVSNGLQHGNDQKPVVIPFSSRLREGRALEQDVWTIFRYVPTPIVPFTRF